MGKLVNVVLPNGRVVSVPEDLAREASGGGTTHAEIPEEATAREVSKLNTERSSGFGEGFKAAAEGFADAASLGGIGALLGAGDDEYARNRAIRAQERPGARLGGELTALLLPTGALGSTGRAVGSVLPSAVAGNAALRAGGRLAEGAVYGIGASVASANVSGDPLSIESVVADAGVGAIINFGLGKIADSFGALGHKAKETIAKRKEADRAISVLSTKPASYDELVTTFSANKDAVKQAQKVYDSASAVYQKELDAFLKVPKSVEKAITNLDVLERTAVHQLVDGHYGNIKVGDYAVESILGKPISSGITSSKIKLTTEDRLILHAAKDIFQEARTSAKATLSRGDEIGALNILNRAMEDVEAQVAAIRVGSKAENGVFNLKLPNLLPVPTLPKLPHGNRPVNYHGEQLPRTLEQFANMSAASVKAMANAVDDASPLAAAVGKFAEDIGVSLKGGPRQALIDTHAILNDMAGKAATKSTGRVGGKGNIIDAIRQHSKYGIRYGLGRVADNALGGGFGGAAARTITGAAAGYALDGVEGAVIGATLVNGKAATKARMDNLFARYGASTSSGISKMAPVTSYLGVSFITGEPDKETDLRAQALNRVNELTSLAGSLNDVSYSAVQDITDQPEDIAFKMHDQVVRTVQYLLGTSPRDPGMATNMFQSYWKPTTAQAIKLARHIEVATAPMDAIERLTRGDGDLETANALWSMWPAHLQEAAAALANNALLLNNLTREQSSSLSRIFRIPLNGFSQPENIAKFQSLFLPQTPAEPSIPPSKRPTGGPSGRPAAVNSPNPNQSRVSQLQTN